MPAPEAAQRHYRTQQQLAATAATGARRIWSQFETADLDRSWTRLGKRLQALLIVAQARAASDGVAYLPAVLGEQGIDAPTTGEIDISQLVGVASSGGRLDDLLYRPIIRAKSLIGGGTPTGQAMNAARSLLDGIVTTQIADAGRVATGLATVARPDVGGYTRMLTRPSCSRCIVQAGKFFRWNRGFLRHPRCDCVHVPTIEDLADDIRTDPRGAFNAMTPEQQHATFGDAGAKAIRDGADIGQVVNARDGMYTASMFGRQVRGTYGSATAYSRFGKTNPGLIRLMPEQIYADAKDRDDAIRLLRRFGYIT